MVLNDGKACFTEDDKKHLKFKPLTNKERKEYIENTKENAKFNLVICAAAAFASGILSVIMNSISSVTYTRPLSFAFLVTMFLFLIGVIIAIVKGWAEIDLVNSKDYLKCETTVVRKLLEAEEGLEFNFMIIQQELNSGIQL